MPLSVPNATPPKAPELRLTADPTRRELAEASHQLQHWAFAFVSYINRQLEQLRAVANWIVQQQGIRNLVPDSDIKDPVTFWNIDAGWAVTDGVGYGGGRGFTISGGSVTADATSDPMVVVPGGDNYVLSGWIDATNLVTGTLSWVLIDSTTSAVLAELTQLAGQSSRVQLPVEIPATTLLVRVVARAVGVTVTGSGIVMSQPQLEIPHSGIGVATSPEATIYRANVGDH